MDMVGVWRIRSAVLVNPKTGTWTELYGASVYGRTIIEPNGHMIAIVALQDRSRAATESDAVKLFHSMLAYSGRITIDDEKVTIHVDMAWDPSWIGTDQVRHYSFDGTTLTLRTPPLELSARPGRGIVVQIDYEREA